MLPTDFDPSLLPDRWSIVRASDASRELEDELGRELSEAHRLSDVVAQAVAVKRMLKDVIFYLPVEKSWAVVHLTGRPESSPRWPSTTVVTTWAAVIEELGDSGPM